MLLLGKLLKYETSDCRAGGPATPPYEVAAPGAQASPRPGWPVEVDLPTEEELSGDPANCRRPVACLLVWVPLVRIPTVCPLRCVIHGAISHSADRLGAPSHRANPHRGRIREASFAPGLDSQPATRHPPALERSGIGKGPARCLRALASSQHTAYRHRVSLNPLIIDARETHLNVA